MTFFSRTTVRQVNLVFCEQCCCMYAEGSRTLLVKSDSPEARQWETDKMSKVHLCSLIHCIYVCVCIQYILNVRVCLLCWAGGRLGASCLFLSCFSVFPLPSLSCMQTSSHPSRFPSCASSLQLFTDRLVLLTRISLWSCNPCSEPPEADILRAKKKKKGGGPGQILPELNLISPHWLDMWYMKRLTAWLRMCLGFRSSAGRTWLRIAWKMKIQRDIDTNQPTFLLFSLLFRTSLHLFFTFTLYVIISLSWALVKHGWLHLPVKAMSVRHPDKGEHYVNVLYGYIWDL